MRRRSHAGPMLARAGSAGSSAWQYVPVGARYIENMEEAISVVENTAEAAGGCNREGEKGLRFIRTMSSEGSLSH
jgi:hypothetical protein